MKINFRLFAATACLSIAAASLTACEAEQTVIVPDEVSAEIVDDCPEGYSQNGEPCK